MGCRRAGAGRKGCRRAGAGRKPKSQHEQWLSGTTSRARAANQPSNVVALPVKVTVARGLATAGDRVKVLADCNA